MASIDPRPLEVWMVNFDPSVGSEFQKIRPAVVMNSGAISPTWPIRIVVPITGWSESMQRRPWMVRIEPDSDNGLSKTSGGDTAQIKGIAIERFDRRIGQISTADGKRVFGTILSKALCFELVKDE